MYTKVKSFIFQLITETRAKKSLNKNMDKGLNKNCNVVRLMADFLFLFFLIIETRFNCSPVI